MTVQLLRILFFTILTSAILCSGALSQSKCCFTLKGQLTYKNGDRAPSTIVSLYKNKDSLRLLSAITDSSGSFRFSALPEGDYFIGVEFGRNKTRLLPELYNVTRSIDSVSIQIDPTRTLEEVVVTSKKP